MFFERFEQVLSTDPSLRLTHEGQSFTLIALDKDIAGASLKGAERVILRNGNLEVHDIQDQFRIRYQENKKVPDGSGNHTRLWGAQAHGPFNFHNTRSGGIAIDYTSRFSFREPIVFVNVGTQRISVSESPLNSGECYVETIDSPYSLKQMEPIFASFESQYGENMR